MKVLHYLNTFPDKVIYFRDNNTNDLVIYADSSSNIHDDTWGHTVIIGKLFGNTIIIKSIKRRIVTKSTTEAGLVALDEAATYIPWICGLLDELKFNYSIIYQDNKSTIVMAEKSR